LSAIEKAERIQPPGEARHGEQLALRFNRKKPRTMSADISCGRSVGLTTGWQMDGPVELQGSAGLGKTLCKPGRGTLSSGDPEENGNDVEDWIGKSINGMIPGSVGAMARKLTCDGGMSPAKRPGAGAEGYLAMVRCTIDNMSSGPVAVWSCGVREGNVIGGPGTGVPGMLIKIPVPKVNGGTSGGTDWTTPV
jgi:hypothetical protein